MIEMEGSRPIPLEPVLSLGGGGAAWLELRPLRGGALPLPLALLRAMDERLAEVERLAHEGRISFLVVTTGAPHPNLIGYDLEELRTMQPEDLISWSHEAQGVLGRLAQLPIPSVAAIRGKWLGAATELALSCTYRVAASAEITRLGLPQVRLGFLPAWGGTARLSRLIGVRAALRTILAGESLTIERARELGIIDRGIAEDAFMERVERYMARQLERGGASPKRRESRSRFLEGSAAGQRLLASRLGRRSLRPRTDTPSGHAAWSVLMEGHRLPLERALAIESRAAAELILTPEMQARLHAQRLADRARARPASELPAPGAIAVLGSGATASDFAARLAAAGIRVRLKEESRAEVRAALARVQERFAWEERQRRITGAEALQRSGRVEGSAGYGGFGTLEMVIALPERYGEEAAQLLAGAEAHTLDGCILAAPIGSIPLTTLQAGLRRPERVLGIAPGLPLDRFPLLEIIPGAQTEPGAIAAMQELARTLGLTGVVLPEATLSPGTRLLALFLAEALQLLEEGADPERIDQIAVEFGFAAGPLHRLDALGTPRALRILRRVAAERGEWIATSPLLEQLAARSEPIFRYRHERPAGRNPLLPAPGELPEGVILERLLLILLREAIAILEEGGVTDPGDLELIAIFGLGFPRKHGGLLYGAEARGIEQVTQDLERAAGAHGSRFAPSAWLRERAARGIGFFTPIAPPPPRPPAAGQNEAPMLN